VLATVSITAALNPLAPMRARAVDAVGVSDAYAFLAQATATSSAAWIGGAVTYQLLFNTCILLYSEPDPIPETALTSGCSIQPTSFTVNSAVVCGSGSAIADDALQINELDTVSTTTVRYGVTVIAGVAFLSGGTTTESDSGAASAFALFTMIPVPPLGTPNTAAQGDGPCASRFIADGVIVVTDA
jgi:hypothetical protein